MKREWIEEAVEIFYEDEEIAEEIDEKALLFMEEKLPAFAEKLPESLRESDFFEIINILRDKLIEGEINRVKNILEGKMGVVTVTFEYGSKGLEFAKELAKLSGYDVLYKEILIQTAKRLNLPTDKLEEFDDFNYLAAKLSLADFLQFSRKFLDFSILKGESEEEREVTFEEFKEMLVKVVMNMAFSNNVILVGHGACAILAEYPNTVHIKIEAPMDYRAKLCAEKLGISVEEATERIEQLDERELKFYKDIAGVDIRKIDLFHTKFNSAKLSPATAAKVAYELVKRIAND
ncbi:cytidylate kinase-like family protein [Desulfurobacterium sp. TC5-1]|uniref:cytidylate kinase-like family protein n=1 Tax=Desulfurobacterium sp. TC5-1 TaxID=1158318 RepID=UPI0003B32323|nr:cytidylate kinase-like family protein [Desulfurobacterium sp. TC5-1]